MVLSDLGRNGATNVTLKGALEETYQQSQRPCAIEFFRCWLSCPCSVGSAVL